MIHLQDLTDMLLTTKLIEIRIFVTICLFTFTHFREK